MSVNNLNKNIEILYIEKKTVKYQEKKMNGLVKGKYYETDLKFFSMRRYSKS